MHKLVNTVQEGIAFTKDSGFPVIVKGSYALGKAVIVVENEEELTKVLESALQLSPISEARVEKVEYLTESSH